jgi:hypothetical protein
MTTFDERERAFEKKFSIDQEFKFKAHARCNKLLAEWAADKLGLSGPQVGAYVRAVVKADLTQSRDGALDKLKRDLESKGVSDTELRSAFAEFLAIAVRQLEDADEVKSM